MLNETLTSWRFNEALWDMSDVVGWLLYRDPKNFGALLTSGDLRRATWKENAGVIFRELLNALQRGVLKAYRNCKEIPSDEWFAQKQPWEIIAHAMGNGVVFRSADVLRLYPEGEIVSRKSPTCVGPAPELIEELMHSNAKPYEELVLDMDWNAFDKIHGANARRLDPILVNRQPPIASVKMTLSIEVSATEAAQSAIEITPDALDPAPETRTHVDEHEAAISAPEASPAAQIPAAVELDAKEQKPQAGASEIAEPAPERVSQYSVAMKAGEEVFKSGVPASLTTREISAAIAEKLKEVAPNIVKTIETWTLARVARDLKKRIH
jgi:hypothetical protein